MQRVSVDPFAFQTLKFEATAALDAFPADCDLATCFLRLDDDTLARSLTAIKTTRHVFQRAQCSALSEPTRAAVAATSRHFPEDWEMTGVLWERLPRAWVESHLLRDMDTAAVLLICAHLGMLVTDAMCARLIARSGRRID